MNGTNQNGFSGLGTFTNGLNHGLSGNALLKLWLDGQQSAFQTMAAAAVPGTTGTGEDSGPLQPLTNLWKTSLEKWLTLAQQQADENSSEETLRKLFDPSQWVKASQDPFHNAIEHLASGPSYATLWDMDKKMLRAQQLHLEQERNIGAYHTIIRAGWKKAYDLFLADVNNEDAAPIKSWRETTDIWVKVANKVMVEMHRTPEFLEAQRRMTRSATDYRLQEREIVEAFCDAHHIPTRTEVDEVQHTVHDLRRQVRQLQRTLDAMLATKAPAAVATTATAPTVVPASPTTKEARKTTAKTPVLKLVSMPRLMRSPKVAAKPVTKTVTAPTITTTTVAATQKKKR